MLRRNEDVFAADSKKPTLTTITEHKIITENALPVRHKTRRLPKAWEQDIHEQIKDMLEKEIIRPSKSPWNSPLLLVKKKDNTTRFVLDFRSLNDVSKKDSYPLPNIRDVIDRMDGVNYWSTLDAASAYWSVPLAEEDKEKTAFAIPRGKFEFNVMPYGLCNAGATYQRLIDICLSDIPSDRVLAYMDDFIIFSRNFEEHLLTLEMVLECLRAAGVTLKPPKCVIGSDCVDFLGYQLSREGIKPQERLTEAIDTFQTPCTKKEVKRFIGLAGFYRQFIKDFALISTPLSRLTSDQYTVEQTYQ